MNKNESLESFINKYVNCNKESSYYKEYFYIYVCSYLYIYKDLSENDIIFINENNFSVEDFVEV